MSRNTPTPLVMLHGFTGAPESWDELQKAVPEQPVLTPTLFGHGPSFQASHLDPSSFDEAVEHLAEEIRARFGGLRVDLVGYSLGGRVALRLALLKPELPQRLLLIGVHPGLKTAEEQAKRVESDRCWARMLREDGLETFVRAWEALPLFSRQPDSVEALPRRRSAYQRQHRLRLRHQPEGLARSLEVMGLGQMPPAWDQLSRLSCPISWLAGETDSKFTQLAREASGLCRQGDVKIVPSAGHNVVIDQPDAVLRLLRESHG